MSLQRCETEREGRQVCWREQVDRIGRKAVIMNSLQFSNGVIFCHGASRRDGENKGNDGVSAGEQGSV